MSHKMKRGDASIAIIYKNFAANKNVSHIGLGVAAMNNSKVLRALGLKVDVCPCVGPDDIRKELDTNKRTHVIISAPWIPTDDIAQLAQQYSDTYFAVNCHSNVGFLQADPNGTKLFREGLNLQSGTHNFRVAANSSKFVEWVQAAFGSDCAYLPNCYYLDSHSPVEPNCGSPGGNLHIGIFGATRPLKNMMSAAGAALQISRQLRRPIDVWISSGRTEGGGAGVLAAVQNLFAGLPGVRLNHAGWASWPDFRRLVGMMSLLLQPSYTESFNMVTADGIAQGVPSVVSDAIDWVPDYWQAKADDVVDIAETGIRVLHHRHAPMDGYEALVKHNAQGAKSWAKELGIDDVPEYCSTLRPHGVHRYA